MVGIAKIGAWRPTIDTHLDGVEAQLQGGSAPEVVAAVRTISHPRSKRRPKQGARHRVKATTKRLCDLSRHEFSRYQGGSLTQQPFGFAARMQYHELSAGRSLALAPNLLPSIRHAAARVGKRMLRPMLT